MHLDFLVPMSQYWYTVSENDPYIYIYILITVDFTTKLHIDTDYSGFHNKTQKHENVSFSI